MTKKLAAFALVVALGALFAPLLLGYHPDTVLNQTASYYAEHTARDLGAANIVTAIVVTYRGLDTLGEVTVLFLSAAIIGLVLSRGRKSQGVGGGSLPAGELLCTGSRLLTPLIMLLGAYIFINGHLTPGGGFQGGAVIASGVLLLLLADPARRLGHRVISVVESLSGVTYVGIGLVGLYFFAGGFLDNRILPIGTLGHLFSAGAIPVIYSLIGLKVGSEFSSILADLKETEEL